MSKTEQLNELFASWRNRYEPSGFAEDGIVDEESWDKASRKILFLDKETNNCPKDVRELINSKPWEVWGYWSFGLLYTTIDRIPQFYQAKERSNWNAAHRATAILNLKKKPGGSAADMGAIRDTAIKDKDFILKEIKIIQPQIVVCGSTFDICKELASEYNFAPIGRDDHCFISMNSLWINFWHPGWFSLPRIIGYYGLMNIFQNALREPQVAKLFSVL